MGIIEIKKQNELLRKQIENYESERKEREAKYESERKERENKYEAERKKIEDRYDDQRKEYDNMQKDLLNRLDQRDKENKELLQKISNNEKIFKTTVMQTSILIQNLMNTPNPNIELIKCLNKLLETQATILKEDENYF